MRLLEGALAASVLLSSSMTLAQQNTGTEELGATDATNASGAAAAADSPAAALPEPSSEPLPPSGDVAASVPAAPPADAPAEAEPTRERARSALVEEVIVTAQKREEKLANVPISIQAFSPEALAARGIESQLGLTRAVPSLDVGSQAGYATIFLRGIGTEAFLTADPSIASYVDGVYFPFSPTFIQDFAGVERVEVLKGPQGTLFGRNAVGGAISVTSKAPDFAAPSTSLEMTVGNDGLLKPRIYTNVPITDNFAMNLSAYYSNAESYLEGTTAGQKPRDEISQGVRVKARWAPLDELDITLGMVRTRNQGNGAAGVNLHPSPLGQLAGIQAPDNPRAVESDERLYGVSDTQLFSGQIVYNAPWVDVKLLGSQQHDSLLYNYDFDSSPEPLVSFDVPGHPADIRQGELQLISNDSMPYDDWLKLTGGVFLFHNIQGFNPVEVTVANFDPTSPSSLLFGTSYTDFLPQGTIDQLTEAFGPNGLLAQIAGGALPDGRAYRVRAVARIETQSAGYYLQSTMKFTDWMSLTLGGRYQNEERSVYRSSIDVVAFQTAIGETLLDRPPIVWQNARDADGNVVPNHKRTKGFFPKVTVDFHPFLDDTLVFASYQTAKKAAAFNAFAIYLPPQYIKPEETTAYELGLRTSLFDGLTRVSAALFRYDIKNLQTQYVSLASGGALAFENAPKAHSTGIDFDATTELFPNLIDGLAMSLNGAFIDAKFGTYTSAAGYSKTTGLFSPNNDFSGNRQTRTPKFSGTVSLSKLWVEGNNEIELGSNYYYNSGFYYSASNDPNYEQKSYGLVGAYARYQYTPWHLGIRVFGNNLTDKFYTQGVISTDFGGVFTIAPPITYGATVSWEF
ncbi:TonB-dependent receptor [Hydrocarboniphaga sp.]|uniref:TonB-dependent receptor n=1 Tax=Hydrocarboniphaga sp. TaxID=2033016 RepID=UPI003D0AE9E6